MSEQKLNEVLGSIDDIVGESSKSESNPRQKKTKLDDIYEAIQIMNESDLNKVKIMVESKISRDRTVKEQKERDMKGFLDRI